MSVKNWTRVYVCDSWTLFAFTVFQFISYFQCSDLNLSFAGAVCMNQWTHSTSLLGFFLIFCKGCGSFLLKGSHGQPQLQERVGDLRWVSVSVYGLWRPTEFAGMWKSCNNNTKVLLLIKNTRYYEFYLRGNLFSQNRLWDFIICLSIHLLRSFSVFGLSNSQRLFKQKNEWWQI